MLPLQMEQITLAGIFFRIKFICLFVEHKTHLPGDIYREASGKYRSNRHVLRLNNDTVGSWYIEYRFRTFYLNFYMSVHKMSRVSSGSIVSDYGLDDRAIALRSPAGAKDFSSSLCAQTGSGAHPASCTMGTGGPFFGGKARQGRDADHSPHLMPRS
jgi:hypothetical protein